MTARHGDLVRGLSSAARSPLFEGRFGRMFRALPAAQFGSSEAESSANLAKLGAAMSAGFDPPKDGPDDGRERDSRALYLPRSVHRPRPYVRPGKQRCKNSLTRTRSSIFARPRSTSTTCMAEVRTTNPICTTGGQPAARGCHRRRQRPASERPAAQRGAEPARAIIGDPRNDENALVSQLHGLFVRFHNRTRADNPTLAHSPRSSAWCASTTSTWCCTTSCRASSSRASWTN